jgi:hypothetical protein
MRIFALDPGTEETGYVIFDGDRVLECGILPNEEMLSHISAAFDCNVLACEMVASYGMAVGRETFETCVWIGRFIQTWAEHGNGDWCFVYRKDVKIHLCGSMKAKDANISQALRDRFGEVGTKKNPGPLFGIKSHIWSALAVAVTALETKL